MKTSQGWSYFNNANTPVTPDSLDSDGYPVSISNTGVYTVFQVPSQAERPGNYVVTWDGTGTIIVNMNNTLVSGSKTSSGGAGAGRYVFSTTVFRFQIGIASIGSPHITNMKVFHADDEAAIIAGQIFGVKFKARLAEARFGVLRFLNWQQSNLSQVTTWASRKKTSYFTYLGSEYSPSLYGGVTTNSGNVYSVAAPPAWNGLVDKAVVLAIINASASGAPCTLNVGGTGDINMLNYKATALTASTVPQGGTSNSLASFVYDAVLNAWLKQGGDTANNATGLVNGMPEELMLQLCVEVGAHPWFVAPPFAVTPMTDYFPSLAQYCKSNGSLWMTPFFEGCNETWNSAANFVATGYANAVATAYGWGADFQNWYGKIISTIGQAVSTVYGNDRTKYRMVCAIQTATAGSHSNDPRLASTLYLAQTPQSPYTASAASGWVTHGACSNYFWPTDWNSGATETALAAAYGGANFTGSISGTALTTSGATGTIAIGQTIQSVGTNASSILPGTVITGGSGTSWTVNNSQTIASQYMTGGIDLTAPVTYANTANSGAGTGTLTAIAALFAALKTWLQGFGIQKVCCYEGGYSPDYASDGNSDIDRLRASSKLAPNVQTFTTSNYNNFVGLSDGTFTAEFPSCFQFAGSINSTGYSRDAWSVLEDIYVTPNPPSWVAIVNFNHS